MIEEYKKCADDNEDSSIVETLTQKCMDQNLLFIGEIFLKLNNELFGDLLLEEEAFALPEQDGKKSELPD